MSFGIGPLTGQIPPVDRRDSSTVYEELIGIIELAESNGVDSVWIAEHHFTGDGHISSPFAFMGAAASRTSEIDLGTAVAIPAFRHPVRLAEMVATVDVISNGRVRVGLGLGYRDEEFVGFGIEKSDRVDAVSETVDVLNTAWNRKSLQPEENSNPSYPPDVTPEVVQQPRPEIGIGAVTEQAVKRAGTIGDRWIAGQFHTVDEINERIQWLSETPGETNPPIVLRHCFIREEDAWETARPGVEFLERKYHDWNNAPFTEQRLEEIRANGFFGNPAAVRAEIREFLTHLSSRPHLVLWMCYPGLSKPSVANSIELFANQVRPSLET